MTTRSVLWSISMANYRDQTTIAAPSRTITRTDPRSSGSRREHLAEKGRDVFENQTAVGATRLAKRELILRQELANTLQ
jgi:hypothetical protein